MPHDCGDCGTRETRFDGCARCIRAGKARSAARQLDEPAGAERVPTQSLSGLCHSGGGLHRARPCSFSPPRVCELGLVRRRGCRANPEAMVRAPRRTRLADCRLRRSRRRCVRRKHRRNRRRASHRRSRRRARFRAGESEMSRARRSRRAISSITSRSRPAAWEHSSSSSTLRLREQQDRDPRAVAG